MRSSPRRKPVVRVALLGSVLVAGAAVWVPASVPESTGPAQGYAWCAGTGPLVVTQLPDRLDLASCPIVGRTVVLDAAPGSAGVAVPEPGVTIGVAAVGATSEQLLEISNDGTHLTVKQAPADSHEHAATSSARASCAESTYKLTDRGAARWTEKLSWRYNSGTTARAGLDPTKALRNIRLGNTNLTANIFGCTNGGFAAWGNYLGTTGNYANVDGYGRCTSKFPDGQNTVSWGPLSGTSALAVTCFAYTAGGMIESDTKIGSNRSIVNKLPSRCSNKWDLQSVMTHEWGHAFGLAHVGESDLTMHTYVGPCSYRARSLGYGDERGMRTLYGPR